jgi:hypothetical protein
MATTVRLEAATEQRLDQLAQLTGRTKAFYLRQLIKAGLDDLVRTPTWVLLWQSASDWARSAPPALTTWLASLAWTLRLSEHLNQSD